MLSAVASNSASRARLLPEHFVLFSASMTASERATVLVFRRWRDYGGPQREQLVAALTTILAPLVHRTGISDRLQERCVEAVETWMAALP